MDKIVVQGGRRLSGEVQTSGAKNSALPVIAASLLSARPCHIKNVPDVVDIRTLVSLLIDLGAEVERPAAGEFRIDCSAILHQDAPYDLVRTMRASFLVLGPLLARFGRARVSRPGGCAIGGRPVDIHLAAMHRLGARIRTRAGYVEASASRLRGGHIILEKPSVGATENLLMAASLAAGTTRIENAAREPEVVDLAAVLTKMGARIEGAGTSVVEIEGRTELNGFEHSVIGDRIEAGTFLIAGALTRGRVLVKGARAADHEMLIEALRASGVEVGVEDGGIRVFADRRPRAVDVTTAPHPGFPTDLQAQFMVLMCMASGSSVVTETIFENRFMHVQELMRMGADIRLEGNRAIVKGQVSLCGASVMATDLRASVCLVLAGLAAEETTEVMRVYHLDRGYERLEEKLRGLGACIERVPVAA